MNIDCILHPASATSTEVSHAFAMTAAVAETIREAGSVPSGTIYAALVGRITLEGYEKLLGVLKRAGLVSVDSSHVITWTGPKFEVQQ